MYLVQYYRGSQISRSEVTFEDEYGLDEVDAISKEQVYSKVIQFQSQQNEVVNQCREPRKYLMYLEDLITQIML